MSKQAQNHPFQKLYVVTQDLGHSNLWADWCEQHNFILPEQSVFEALRSAMREDLQALGFKSPISDDGITVNVELVDPEQFSHLKKGNNAKDAESFWISLDDVCITGEDFSVEVTRVYDWDGNEKETVDARPGRKEKRSLSTQISACCDQIRERSKRLGKPVKVVLADDGLYGGKTVEDILGKLNGHDISVTEVRTAFSTLKGLRKINDYIVKKKNQNAIKCYPGLVVADDTSLIDWVCERDFFLGVPRSGRTTEWSSNAYSDPDKRPIVGRPYVKPWGPMEHAASILQNCSKLSAKLTSHSIELWNAIQKVNNTKLTVGQLPRFPGPGVPNRDEESMLLLDYLEREEKRSPDGDEAKKQRDSNPVLK